MQMHDTGLFAESQRYITIFFLTELNGAPPNKLIIVIRNEG